MGKLARLREMSGAEINYRLQERLRIEMERTGIRKQAPDASQWNVAGSLMQVFDARFYIAPSDRQAWRHCFREQFPEWCERAAREADDLRRHRFELLDRKSVV